MSSVRAPGVYRESVTTALTPVFSTGVPAFVGFRANALDQAEQDRWKALRQSAGSRILHVDAPLWSSKTEQDIFNASSLSYLGSAVRGFFENGGRRCYIVVPDKGGLAELATGLDELEALPGFDLVCAPDLVRLAPEDPTTPPLDLIAAQSQLLTFCKAQGGCFAILDGARCRGVAPDAEIARLIQQQAALASASEPANAALYIPWIKVQDTPDADFVPPSGHVAGVYSRTDQRIGVHKAPANEILSGVFDLELRVGAALQENLNPKGINCVRAFPGRGVRVWGARTLSADPAWTFVNVRRLLLTVKRWLDQAMAGVVFEPNDPKLWIRIRREVSAFLRDLFQKGALRGTSPDQAFFVKCDAENNPAEVRAAGQVVTEIGLAAQAPSEFIVARIVYGASPAGSASAGG